MKFFIPILLILLAVGLFIGYTNPLYQQVKEKNVKLEKIVEANSKAKKLREVRESLTAERNQISEENINKVKKLLPDGVENVRLIIDINNIAAKYGVNITGTKINDGGGSQASQAFGPGTAKYGTIGLSFGVHLSYENFLLFLKDLESSLRLVDVTTLSFTSTKDGQYDFGITIQTYWLK